MVDTMPALTKSCTSFSQECPVEVWPMCLTAAIYFDWLVAAREYSVGIVLSIPMVFKA